MKKRIGIYAIIWVICLALFNVIAFVTPNKIDGVSKFSGAFWVGYIFITVAFIGQLVCVFFAFKEENLKKLFYKLPLISVSYTGLILMLIAGGVCMAIPTIPEWCGIIVCVLILALYAIAVIKATIAATVVEGIDDRVKTQTLFIKNLIAKAHGLMSAAVSDELRAEAGKVYEAIRYSTPVSGNSLAEINLQIEKAFDAFADAVRDADTELCQATSRALIELLEKRNQICK